MRTSGNQNIAVTNHFIEAKSLLLFAPYGNWRVHHQLDAIIAAAMEHRQKQVTYVTCDGFYKQCAIFRDEQRCDVCQAVARETVSSLDVSSIPISDLITPNDVAIADDWTSELTDSSLLAAQFNNLPIGEWAVSSVMTRFRVSNTKLLNQSKITPVHRLYLRDTLITYLLIDRIIKQRGVDCLFLFNARLYPYRAAFEAAKRNSARILVHERGQTNNSFALFEDENCLGHRTSRRLAADWSSIPLTSGETQKLEQYTAIDARGQGNNWPSFYQSIGDNDIYRALDLPQDARLVGFFSSSGDEVGNTEHYKGVAQQFDLIDDIASHLEELGAFLIVRHHPHIGGLGESPVEVTNFYEAYQRSVPRRSNVRVLMPKDMISSYSLFPYLDAAVAPISTIALECLFFGIPTLVSSSSPYCFSEEYTIYDQNKQQLNEKLRFIISTDCRLTDERLRKLFRKAYSQLFRSSIEFKVAGVRDFYHASMTSIGRASVRPGQDDVVDRVCDYLLYGTPVHPRPTMTRLLGPTYDEEQFVSSRLEIVKNRELARAAHVAYNPHINVMPPRILFLIDGPIKGSMSANGLENLVNAKLIDIIHFQDTMPATITAKLLSYLRKRQPDSTFAGFSKRVMKVLESASSEFVLVLRSGHFLHDSSIISICDAAALASASGAPLVTLSGWVHDETVRYPVRVSLSDIRPENWKDLMLSLGQACSSRELLSFALFRRDWLRQILRLPEDAFEEKVFAEANRLGTHSIKEPLFLLVPDGQIP